MDWEAITPELQKKLNPANVKPPPRGKYGEYVEGWHVISEANAIFGFGGWSYRIDRLDEAMRELVWLETAKKEKYQQWRVCHVCQITVTVGAVSRMDIGTGQGQAKPNALGDAIDSSAKEAVTDGLKRALRSFGNRFGLALYDKTKANVGVDDATAPPNAPIPSSPPHDPAPEPPPIADFQIAKDSLQKAATVDALKAIWADLPLRVKSAPAVQAAKNRRKAELEAPGYELEDEIPY